MPNADLNYNCDFAAMANGAVDKECGCDFPPPYGPYPYYPPYPDPRPHPLPPYPYPPIPPEPAPDPKKTSTEGKICKLSKKAAVITTMIDNLETKKKDFIIRAGESTYNFGNVDLEVENWEDGSYADTALKILRFELSLIKTKIAELSAEIGEEAENLAGTPTTVVEGD